MLEHLEEKGWCVVDLPFWGNLNNICGLIERNNPNNDWNSYENDDAEHFSLQKRLTDMVRKSNFIGYLFAENRQAFKVLVAGQNRFLYQNNPYLRIARTSKPSDNIGYHKDTMYGGYPEELSVVIPLVDLDEGMALQVLDGSHKVPDETFTFVQQQSQDIKKGDDKNALGFPYAPKQIDAVHLEGVHPVPLRFGQALVFYLSTLHGQEINSGEHTRWSIDTRIVSADTTRDFSQRPYKYVELP